MPLQCPMITRSQFGRLAICLPLRPPAGVLWLAPIFPLGPTSCLAGFPQSLSLLPAPLGPTPWTSSHLAPFTSSENCFSEKAPSPSTRQPSFYRNCLIPSQMWVSFWKDCWIFWILKNCGHFQNGARFQDATRKLLCRKSVQCIGWFCFIICARSSL